MEGDLLEYVGVAAGGAEEGVEVEGVGDGVGDVEGAAGVVERLRLRPPRVRRIAQQPQVLPEQPPPQRPRKLTRLKPSPIRNRLLSTHRQKRGLIGRHGTEGLEKPISSAAGGGGLVG